MHLNDRFPRFKRPPIFQMQRYYSNVKLPGIEFFSVKCGATGIANNIGCIHFQKSCCLVSGVDGKRGA